MSLFDSLIVEAGKRFGLGDKAGVFLAGLLGLMTDRSRGGFTGFLDRFRNREAGDIASSWISTGENTPLSDAQIESSFSDAEINELADKAGVDRATAASALGFMVPRVVDNLTPDGIVPDDQSLLSSIGGYLTGAGGAVRGAAGAASAAASNAFGNTVDAGRDTVNDVSGTTTQTVNRVDATVDRNSGGSMMKWLLPLILLGLLVALGFWFCGRNPTTVTNTNTSVNANRATNVNSNTAVKTVDSSFRIEARDGKYFVTGVVPDEATKKRITDAITTQYGAPNVDFAGLKVDAAAKPFAAGWWDNFAKMLPNLKDWKNGTLAFAGNAVTEAAGLPEVALNQLKSLFAGWTLPAALNADTATGDRKLTEVSLPSGTKLQAYPGGIEDQLIKFIQSDEYKNGTADSLKDKWFSFDDLNFKFGTTELVPESKRQLDNIVAILKAFPDVKMKIGGYTDKKGDDAANKKLSDDRAKAVKAALDKSGVGAQVPEAEGYGEQFAVVAETAGDKEREADRKTAIRLLK